MARVAALAWALVCLAGPGIAQTDVVTNGSFESGLTSWTTATTVEDSGAGTCSYNGVTAPGTETVTSQVGFAATDGTQTALGYVADTHGTGAIISCVLYQDVAIPAGATTATFSFDIGITHTPGNNTNNGATVGIFSTGTVPGFADAPIVGGASGKNTLTTGHSADAALTHQASATISVSSRAGTTVRFAIINAANNSGFEVVGVDNVRFLVNVQVATVPTLSEWALVGLGMLLAGMGIWALRRRTA